MNRAELQWLAIERLRDARTLLKGGRWSGAYYLSGYAVECGLKSAVLALIERTGVIFTDRKYAEKCWTHDLGDLMQLSGLKGDLDIAMAVNRELTDNWGIVREWTELSRYRRMPKDESEQMYHAVADKPHGVLSWIKTRW